MTEVETEFGTYQGFLLPDGNWEIRLNPADRDSLLELYQEAITCVRREHNMECGILLQTPASKKKGYVIPSFIAFSNLKYKEGN